MKRKDYDDDLIVELIARGELSHAQIGKLMGLNPKTVWRIANGFRRRDLQPRIHAAVNGMIQEAHRKGAKWLNELMNRQIREGLNGTGETARKCREFAINKLMGLLGRERIDLENVDKFSPPGLTREDYKHLAVLKGGPVEEQGDDDTNT